MTTDTNPRVTILCAVSEIREFHAEDAFLMAVGDWLNACASVLAVKPDASKAHALNVAQAFLEKP